MGKTKMNRWPSGLTNHISRTKKTKRACHNTRNERTGYYEKDKSKTKGSKQTNMTLASFHYTPPAKEKTKNPFRKMNIVLLNYICSYLITRSIIFSLNLASTKDFKVKMVSV